VRNLIESVFLRRRKELLRGMQEEMIRKKKRGLSGVMTAQEIHRVQVS
jgi:hypothetical protein